MLLFHLTRIKTLPNILNEGLLPFQCFEWERLLPNPNIPVIWFTDSLRAKGNYLHPSRCLIMVNTNNLDQTLLKNTKHKGWWCYEGTIQPQFVELVHWYRYRIKEPKFWSEYNNDSNR